MSIFPLIWVRIVGVFFFICSIFWVFVHLKARKDLAAKLEQVNEEITVLLTSLSGETDPEDFIYLKDLAHGILQRRDEMKSIEERYNDAIKGFNEGFDEFERDLLKKIRLLEPKGLDFEFPVLEFDPEVSDVGLFGEVDLMSLEEKLFEALDKFNSAYSAYSGMFDFISEIFNYLIKLDQIKKEYSTIFDNIKLVYLNIQLEAIKKGDVADEFIVIGEELRQIYQESDEGKKRMGEVIGFFKRNEEIMKLSGEIKITFENLYQLLNSLTADLGDLKEKIAESNQTGGKLIDHSVILNDKCVEFTKKWKDSGELLNKYLRDVEAHNNRLNVTILDLRAVVEWFRSMKRII